MTFTDDNGQILEVDGEFAMTKQAVSIFNFTLKGDVSINFPLPNTSEVRDILGYFGPNMLNVVSATRKRFTASKDGNTWARGFIIINSDDGDILDCYFTSGNGNWFSSLQNKLSEYDYDSYVVPITAVDSRKASTEGIVFPVIDWAYDGNKLGSDFIASTSYLTFAIYQQPYKQGFQEMFPCFYLKSIFKQISKSTGLKFTGDVFDDQTYNSIIVTPSGPNLQYPPGPIAENYSYVTKSTNQAIPAATFPDTLITFDTSIQEGENENFDFTNSRYYARRKATVKFSFNISLSSSQAYIISIYLNGTEWYPIVNGAPVSDNYNLFFYINMEIGDYLDLRTRGTLAYDVLAGSTVTFEIEKKIEAGLDQGGIIANFIASFVTPAAIVPNIKAVDLVKFLVFYFGCTCNYDEYSNTVDINMIDNITDYEDWSEYIIGFKSDYMQDVGTNNYIKTEEPREEDLLNYNKKSRVDYGGGNIVTNYVNKEERDLYKIPFAPANDKLNNTILGWFLPYIKFYDLSPDDTVTMAITSVSSGTGGLARFNGAANEYKVGDIVNVRISTGTYSGSGIVRNRTSTYIELYGVLFIDDGVGTSIKMRFTTVTGSNRLLYNLPGYSISNSGPVSTYAYRYSSTTNNSTTAAVAFYDKPKTGYGIDSIRQSLAIDNIPGKEFNNTVGDMRYGKTRNIMNNPKGVATMLLPLNVYVSHNFKKKIYIKSKWVTGEFLVESIQDYQDSGTPVTVVLNMI